MNATTIGVYIILGLMFGYFFYSFYDKNIDGFIVNRPVTFYVDIDNFKLDKTEYKPGDAVSIFTSFCINRPIEAKTTWRMISTDGTVQLYVMDRDTQMAVGCVLERWSVIGKIPAEAVKGTYRLEAPSALTITPGKTIYTHFRTIQFTIK